MKMKLIVLSAFALTMISSGAVAIAQQAAPAKLPGTCFTGSATASAAPDEHRCDRRRRFNFRLPIPKNFTATSPTTQEVNSFLKQIWGYDPNRVWEVVGIQTTEAAAKLARVTILVGEQGQFPTPLTHGFLCHAGRPSCDCRFRCHHVWRSSLCCRATEVGSSAPPVPIAVSSSKNLDVGGVCRPAVPRLQDGSAHDGQAGD